jgi:hypothetical protein
MERLIILAAQFGIPASRQEAAFQALLRDTPPSEIGPRDLADLLSLGGYEVEHDAEGNIVGLRTDGAVWEGDEEEFWGALAPFVDIGSTILALRDNSDLVRWSFNGLGVLQEVGEQVAQEVATLLAEDTTRRSQEQRLTLTLRISTLNPHIQPETLAATLITPGLSIDPSMDVECYILGGDLVIELAGWLLPSSNLSQLTGQLAEQTAADRVIVTGHDGAGRRINARFPALAPGGPITATEADELAEDLCDDLNTPLSWQPAGARLLGLTGHELLDFLHMLAEPSHSTRALMVYCDRTQLVRRLLEALRVSQYAALDDVLSDPIIAAIHR